MVTILILTGAVTPLSGLTSTVPSMRGYNDYTLVLYISRAHGAVSPVSQRFQDSQQGSLYLVYPLSARMRSSFDQSWRLTGSMELSPAVQQRGEGGQAPKIAVANAVYVMRRCAR